MATDVRVVFRQGRTAISVDGRPIPGMAYVGPIRPHDESGVRVLREIADAGFRIFFCPWGFRRSSRGPTAWTEGGELDLSVLDESMEVLASLCDDVWIVPRLYMDTPPWWARRHPKELVLFDDSDGVPAELIEGHRNLAQASMASERWRQDVSAVLRRLVDHVETGPHAERVLGYMLNSGGTEEWVYWGAQQGKVPDYSPPALRAFRRWLSEKYGGDFGSVTIPSHEERRNARSGVLRDPAREGPAIDYDLFLSELCAGTLLHFCRVVKEATRGCRLTGSFYGYCLWQTGFFNSVVPNGHAALGKLLESPDIDFITGITSYDNREPGGPGSFMVPVESIQAAGKLVFNEVDLRTHLTRAPGAARFESDRSGPRVLGIWPLETAAESVAVYRREFAHHLIHGTAWWNSDMQGGWYSCPELLEEFKAQSAIARQALDWDMGSVSDVAAVVSEASPARHALFRMHDVAPRELTDLQCDRATVGLYKAGVPVDWWMMRDLGREALRRYRVIYFHNATFLSDQERDLVEGLKGDGRTLIFVGLPGLLNENGRSAEAAEALTGIRLRISDRRLPALLDVVDYEHDVTRECRAAMALGTGALLSPCLTVDDPGADTLAVWRTTGEPAACVRDFGTWRSVFFAVPPNNDALFRAIARTAGCHIWYEADGVVFANRSLLALHVTNHVDRVSLPRPMTVTDLFTGRTLARDALHFTPPDAWHPMTHLWRLEPAHV